MNFEIKWDKQPDGVSLEAMMRRMAKMTEKFFDERGELPEPMIWLIESPKGQAVINTPLYPDNEAKNKLAADLRKLFKQHAVFRYVLAAEGWAGPERQEVVSIQGDDGQDHILIAVREIVRPSGWKRPYLGALEINRMERGAGRFMNMMQPETTYTVHRGSACAADPREISVEKSPIAECSDQASAYAAVIADYAKMNNGQRLVWTRPNWTAVSGTTVWVINIRKSDGTYIYGRTMGPSRLELEQSEVTDEEPPFLVTVLQVKDRVARYVKDNFFSRDRILGEERSGYPLSDGWWVQVIPVPHPQNETHVYGPFLTWEQAEALACQIEEAPTLEHAMAVAEKMPAPEVMQ
jgi:hypothetical protein